MNKEIAGIVKKWVKIVMGSALVILGFAGLLLPVLQGILFLFLGLTLLGSEVPLIKDYTLKIKEYFKKRKGGKK